VVEGDFDGNEDVTVYVDDVIGGRSSGMTL
jgi:hypothetical protein